MPKSGARVSTRAEVAAAESPPGSPGPAGGGDGTAAILAALAALRTDVAASEARTEARFLALEQSAAAAGNVAQVAEGRAAAAAAVPAEDPAGQPEPEARPEGARLADLTEEQVQALISRSVAEAARVERVGGVQDPIPHRKDPKARLPQRLFDQQDSGEYVTTDLLTADEYGELLTGYKTLPEGTAAELDYLYVITKRLEDVLHYVDDVIDGKVAELDVLRLREVLHEVAVLSGERSRLLVKRAFVRGTPQEDHKYETDASVVQDLKDKRAARRRPPGIELSKVVELEKAIEGQLIKQIAQNEAKELFKIRGVGKTGKGPKGGDGAGGAAAPD